MTFERESFEMIWVDEHSGWRLKEANPDNDPSMWLGLIIHDALDHVAYKRLKGWPESKFEQELIAVGSYYRRRRDWASVPTLLSELRDVKERTGSTVVSEAPSVKFPDEDVEFFGLVMISFGEAAARFCALGYMFAQERYSHLDTGSIYIIDQDVAIELGGEDKTITFFNDQGELGWSIR